MKNLNKFIFKSSFLIFLFVAFISFHAIATVFTLDLALSGQKENPANASTATGVLVGTYDDVTNQLDFTLMFNGLSAPATAAHFHGPAGVNTNAGVQIGMAGFPTGVTTGTYSNSYILTALQESQLLCGMWYLNIHNAIYPGGEIRAQLKEGVTTLGVKAFDIALTGQKEFPANASTATGTMIGTFNSATNVLNFSLRFNGLTANATAAHFHGPAPAGANSGVQIGLAGFPTGVTSGFYSNTYTLTATQRNQLLAGLWYVNIHNSSFPGGELRGQLTEGTLTGICVPSVPTLSQWSLILLSLISLSIGMTFIYRKQQVLLFVGAESNSMNNASFFDKSLFYKIFAITAAIAVLALFISLFYFGNVTMIDTIGSIFSAAMVAFMIQLYLSFRKGS